VAAGRGGLTGGTRACWAERACAHAGQSVCRAYLFGGGGESHSSSYQVDNALLPQRRTAAVLWMILMQRAAYERLLDLSQQLRALGCLAPLAPLLRLARLTH
jgi:hypothetical protein